MNTPCKRIREKLAIWFELTEQERQAVREHADGCPACSERLAQTKSLFDELTRAAETYRGLTYRGQPMPRPSKASPVERTLRVRSGGVLRWGLAGAAAAAGILWLVTLQRATERSPVAPRPGPPHVAARETPRPSISFAAVRDIPNIARLRCRLPTSPSSFAGEIRGQLAQERQRYGMSRSFRLRSPKRPTKGGRTGGAEKEHSDAERDDETDMSVGTYKQGPLQKSGSPSWSARYSRYWRARLRRAAAPGANSNREDEQC